MQVEDLVKPTIFLIMALYLLGGVVSRLCGNRFAAWGSAFIGRRVPRKDVEDAGRSRELIELVKLFGFVTDLLILWLEYEHQTMLWLAVRGVETVECRPGGSLGKRLVCTLTGGIPLLLYCILLGTGVATAFRHGYACFIYWGVYLVLDPVRQWDMRRRIRVRLPQHSIRDGSYSDAAQSRPEGTLLYTDATGKPVAQIGLRRGPGGVLYPEITSVVPQSIVELFPITYGKESPNPDKRAKAFQAPSLPFGVLFDKNGDILGMFTRYHNYLVTTRHNVSHYEMGDAGNIYARAFKQCKITPTDNWIDVSDAIFKHRVFLKEEMAEDLAVFAVEGSVWDRLGVAKCEYQDGVHTGMPMWSYHLEFNDQPEGVHITVLRSSGEILQGARATTRFHNGDTSRGDCGGPILARTSGKWKLIGIHKEGSVTRYPHIRNGYTPAIFLKHFVTVYERVMKLQAEKEDYPYWLKRNREYEGWLRYEVEDDREDYGWEKEDEEDYDIYAKSYLYNPKDGREHIASKREEMEIERSGKVAFKDLDPDVVEQSSYEMRDYFSGAHNWADYEDDLDKEGPLRRTKSLSRRLPQISFEPSDEGADEEVEAITSKIVGKGDDAKASAPRSTIPRIPLQTPTVIVPDAEKEGPRQRLQVSPRTVLKAQIMGRPPKTEIELSEQTVMSVVEQAETENVSAHLQDYSFMIGSSLYTWRYQPYETEDGSRVGRTLKVRMGCVNGDYNPYDDYDSDNSDDAPPSGVISVTFTSPVPWDKDWEDGVDQAILQDWKLILWSLLFKLELVKRGLHPRQDPDEIVSEMFRVRDNGSLERVVLCQEQVHALGKFIVKIAMHNTEWVKFWDDQIPQGDWIQLADRKYIQSGVEPFFARQPRMPSLKEGPKPTGDKKRARPITPPLPKIVVRTTKEGGAQKPKPRPPKVDVTPPGPKEQSGVKTPAEIETSNDAEASATSSVSAEVEASGKKKKRNRKRKKSSGKSDKTEDPGVPAEAGPKEGPFINVEYLNKWKELLALEPEGAAALLPLEQMKAALEEVEWQCTATKAEKAVREAEEHHRNLMKAKTWTPGPIKEGPETSDFRKPPSSGPKESEAKGSTVGRGTSKISKSRDC